MEQKKLCQYTGSSSPIRYVHLKINFLRIHSYSAQAFSAVIYNHNFILFEQNVKTAQLHVRASLFSSTSKSFFGRTWVGPSVNYKDGSKTLYNQV